MKPDSMDSLPIPSGIQNMLSSAPQAPVFGQAAGKKPKAASNVASFLTSAMIPAASERGTKTLTGQ